MVTYLVAEDEELGHLLVGELVLELIDCLVDVVHLREHLLLCLLECL